MEIQVALHNIFSLETGQRVVCASALYAVLSGVVNIAAFVVFQTYLPTPLALSCGAVAAFCGVLVDALCSEDNDTLLDYMPVAGAIGSFATAFFSGGGLSLSLYAACMFAMAHIIVKTHLDHASG